MIKLHSRQFYDVGAIGFAPGFAFLSAVDEAIAVPRHSTPRQYVPAGSVGIADQQTAIYPQKSPGGWHIIGNCPQSVFEAQSYPQSCFAIGDKVKFDPIDRSEIFGTWGNDMPSLIVINPGILSLIQDLGRYGVAQQGVTQVGYGFTCFFVGRITCYLTIVMPRN